ncbi:hypothetical protein KL936_000398 [Ogataea polymorpha]|nr:hypothetical protein KL936_000398 [Ogataea polymorpha]
MPLNLGSASRPFTEAHAVHGCTKLPKLTSSSHRAKSDGSQRPPNQPSLDWINVRASELRALKTRRSFVRWLDKQYEALHGDDLLAVSDVLSDEDTPEPSPCTALPAATTSTMPLPKPGTGMAYVITDVITLMAAQAAVVALAVALWWCVFADSTDAAYVRSILAVLKAMLTDKKETK